jgi:hypothetical protein
LLHLHDCCCCCYCCCRNSVIVGIFFYFFLFFQLLIERCSILIFRFATKTVSCYKCCTFCFCFISAPLRIVRAWRMMNCSLQSSNWNEHKLFPSSIAIQYVISMQGWLLCFTKIEEQEQQTTCRVCWHCTVPQYTDYVFVVH